MEERTVITWKPIIECPTNKKILLLGEGIRGYESSRVYVGILTEISDSYQFLVNKDGVLHLESVPVCMVDEKNRKYDPCIDEKIEKWEGKACFLFWHPYKDLS